MTTIELPITNEADWLSWRTQDVTSTESAALFGLSPYMTRFELWHRKRERFVEQMTDTPRLKWGRRLQDAIAVGVAEDMGWQARRLDVYMRDEQDRIGSSFDFEAVCPKRGRGLMEIKNVDRFVFAEAWDEAEGPRHIELQVQHEMEVADLPWCALVALVGGNEAKVIVRERDLAIGRRVRAEVREFWRSVEANEPPSPDYQMDAEFIATLYGKADTGLTIDADDSLQNLIAHYHRLGEADGQRKALKAQILERIGTACRVRTPFGTLSCGEVKPSTGTLITAEMVGQRIGGREGFRLFRFTPKKDKPND